MKIRNFKLCLFLVCLALPCTTQAQIDRDCLKENTLNKEYKGPVTLFTLDTTSIRGRLLKIDFDNDLLTVEIGSRSKSALSTYAFDSLAAVRFYKGGHIDGEWILAGFIGGGLLGAGISATGEKSGSLSRNVQYWGGFIAGGLAGLFLGFFLPPILNSQTIECGSVEKGET